MQTALKPLAAIRQDSAVSLAGYKAIQAHEPSEPQKIALDQMDGCQADCQTKAFFGESGDSNRSCLTILSNGWRLNPCFRNQRRSFDGVICKTMRSGGKAGFDLKINKKQCVQTSLSVDTQ